MNVHVHFDELIISNLEVMVVGGGVGGWEEGGGCFPLGLHGLFFLNMLTVAYDILYSES